jgi:putative ABC transport system permease protein
VSLFQLALRNLSGSAFRSWVVALCAALVAGFAIGTVLVMRGAQQSLNLAAARLGADIVIVPEGSEMKVEGALLMGHPTRVWMSQEVLSKVATIPGVQVATPQLYLSTLTGASCCSVSDMFLVAYDPATDFTIQPWLIDKTGDTLHLGEVVGGTYVFIPEGEQNISIYGYLVTLKANMEPTGTGLDQSMFTTFETARDIARISVSMADEPLVIPENSISAVMVRVAPGQDPRQVSLEIMHQVPDVTPILSPDMFQSYRQQINGILGIVVLLISGTVILSVLLIGLVFSMAANERRVELGVLRALGATRGFVFQSLLAEAGLLALGGGASGIALTVVAVYLFRQLIINTLNIPFILPSIGVLVAQILIGLVLALVSVTIAALVPALQISRQEPAIAMRE